MYQKVASGTPHFRGALLSNASVWLHHEIIVFEWRHQRPNGEVWDAEVHLMSFLSGERMLLQFTLQDITEHKRAQEAQQKSEANFQSIFEKSAAGYVLLSPDGRLLKVNPAMAGMLGYTVDEIQKFNFQDITHPDDISASAECMRSLQPVSTTPTGSRSAISTATTGWFGALSIQHSFAIMRIHLFILSQA